MSEHEAAFIAQHIEHGSHAHYAVLFTPAAQRLKVAAVFAFHRAMRELLAIQPDVAPTKISWWHEEITRLRAGNAVHPIGQELNDGASDALCDALNALLHGAVMDFNQIDVDDSELDDYLQRRDGALHDAVAAVSGTSNDMNADHAVARLQSIPILLGEARHPLYAKQPSVTLRIGDSNEAIEAALVQRFNDAREHWAPEHAATPASAVSIALALRLMPLVLATEYGQVAARPGPWRTLWTAWRAARHSTKKGSMQ